MGFLQRFRQRRAEIRQKAAPQARTSVCRNDKFFDYATATSKGTKMPRGDKRAVMEYDVPDFSLEDQQRIASILKSLDDKIALNRTINKNLA